MPAVDIIRKKRDSHALDDGEIRNFVSGVTDGSWSDYQASALLMAICIRGMDGRETATLTDAMVHSGARLDWSEFGTVPVDKHSTGGVGDKTSMVIAPAAAACGAIVPMMSGRGLGHTGGTLDKLESIPGFRTNLTVADMRAVLRKTGSGFEVLGEPAGIEQLGGVDFDEAVLAHVVDVLGPVVQDLDPADPAVVEAPSSGGSKWTSSPSASCANHVIPRTASSPSTRAQSCSRWYFSPSG